jgi:hypothetical protein
MRPSQNWKHAILTTVLFAGAENTDKHMEHYRANKNDMCAIKETEDLDQLGPGFTSADPFKKIDIGDGVTPRPTFVKKDLNADYKASLIKLLKEYVNCFAWNY